MQRLGVKTPPNCQDGSIYVPEYGITEKGEPICLSEYASQIIAESAHAYILLVEDFSTGMGPQLTDAHISPDAVFNELVLTQRPGRTRLSYAFNAKFEKIC